MRSESWSRVAGFPDYWERFWRMKSPAVRRIGLPATSESRVLLRCAFCSRTAVIVDVRIRSRSRELELGFFWSIGLLAGFAKGILELFSQSG